MSPAAPPIISQVPEAALGWVRAARCRVGPSSPELLAEVARTCREALATAREAEASARRAAVRDLLRHGAYKPTGRGKPASEYLLRAASEGSFPTINALVDIGNLVSLASLLPISLVDVDRAGTELFAVRRGRAGESYVFNPSGQVLDLRDLLLTARMPDDAPCATPVKDCQETKTHGGTQRVLAVVYAPLALAAAAAEAASHMARLFGSHCGADALSGTIP